MGKTIFNSISAGELTLLNVAQTADVALIYNHTTKKVEAIDITKAELEALKGIGATTLVAQLAAKVGKDEEGVTVATLEESGGKHTIPLDQLPDSIKGGLHYMGLYDASVNAWPDAGGDTNKLGDFYIVSKVGTTAPFDTMDPGTWLVRNSKPYADAGRWDVVPPTAAGKVKKVNNISPDANGEVTVGPSAIQAVALPADTHAVPLKTDVAQIGTNKTAIATNVAAIALNTAKTGITGDQATAILANTAKTSVPIGGKTDQILAKKSDTDEDIEWQDAPPSSDEAARTEIKNIKGTAKFDDATPIDLTAAKTAIDLNTAKTGITPAQAKAITDNTTKNEHQDTAIANKADISATAPVVGSIAVWESDKIIAGTIKIGDVDSDIPQLHDGKLAPKVIPFIPMTEVEEFTVDRIDPDPATPGEPMIIPDDDTIWTGTIVPGWNAAGIVPTGGCVTRILVQDEYNVGDTPPTKFMLHETWSFGGDGDWTDKTNWVEHKIEDNVVYSWDGHEGIITRGIINNTVKELDAIKAIEAEIKGVVELDSVSINNGTPVKNEAHDGTLYFNTDDSIEMTAKEHTDKKGIDIGISSAVKPFRMLVKTADVVGGIITATHNLGSDFLMVSLTDDAGSKIVPDESPTDTNVLKLDVGNIGAVPAAGKPWKLVIFGAPQLVGLFK